jgi:hypothetical protein
LVEWIAVARLVGQVVVVVLLVAAKVQMQEDLWKVLGLEMAVDRLYLVSARQVCF